MRSRWPGTQPRQSSGILTSTLDGFGVACHLDATPTASGERLRSGGTTLATLTVKTNRQIEVRQGGAGYGLSTALTVGTVYRLGLRSTKSTSGATGVLVPLTLDDVVLDTGVLPGLASGAPTRTIGYGYDGVDRLTSVAETTTVHY